jgi:hypothetical protein
MPLDPQSPLVWSSQAGNSSSLSVSTFRENWRQVCHAAGVLDRHRKPLRLHDLRHHSECLIIPSCAQPTGKRRGICRFLTF